MATPADLPTDGRVQRSERSREAIVQAMLELIGAGILSPTAQQVAERADVGVRTVFRHFNDMETLFATLSERLTEEVGELLVEVPQEGSLPARLDGLIENRCALFEKLTPFLRSSARKRPRSAFIRSQHDQNTRDLRIDLHRWLPELDRSDAEIGAALELLLSFEAFDRLRTEQGLSARRTRQTIRRAVEAVATELG